ncbi:class I SAM-dependent methyltransferase [Aliikangiella maris]|uniref:Class I SAM-dependent methyltransferase n=2 Tax=Aliikangiella maris TaxID=3162458 RepID=A0ABV2BS84_9GAMM
MHSKRDSLLKRWHSLTISPKKCQQKWGKAYWKDVDGYREVNCVDCPSFNAQRQQCSIGFGSPLRKCVVSSIEAHLHDCQNQQVLEIGFGKFMLARNLIKRSGGTWTGIEPRRPKSEVAQLGKGGYGHATYIPFEDKTFDKIFAIQSIEHWGQKAGAALREPSDYAACFAEVARVLKPGGTIYFDAPIHFHGHEMFIMGDLAKIQSYLMNEHWTNVHIEKWREQSAPLKPYDPPQNVLVDWPIEITSYPETQVKLAREKGSVWMIAITAEKT